MPHHVTVDPGRFLSHVAACRREEDLFRGLLRETPIGEERRSPACGGGGAAPPTISTAPIKTVSLVEENGTLYWRDGIPARPAARRDAAVAAWMPTSERIARVDPRVPDARAQQDHRGRRRDRSPPEPGDRRVAASRLRALRQTPDGTFELQDGDVVGTVLRAARCCSSTARSRTPPTCSGSSPPTKSAASGSSIARRGARRNTTASCSSTIPRCRSAPSSTPWSSAARWQLQRAHRRHRAQPRRPGRALVARSVRQLAAHDRRIARCARCWWARHCTARRSRHPTRFSTR